MSFGTMRTAMSLDLPVETGTGRDKIGEFWNRKSCFATPRRLQKFQNRGPSVAAEPAVFAWISQFRWLC